MEYDMADRTGSAVECCLSDLREVCARRKTVFNQKTLREAKTCGTMKRSKCGKGLTDMTVRRTMLSAGRSEKAASVPFSCQAFIQA